MTVYKLFTKWVENNVKTYLKRGTYRRYKSNIENYIKNSSIENLNIKDISSTDINKFMNELSNKYSDKRKKLLSSTTINNVYILLQQGFKYGISENLIFSNPCTHFNKLKNTSNKKRRSLSKNEQIVLERELLKRRDPILFGVYLALYTGMRIGEIIELKWSDISFENKEIYITRIRFSDKNTKGHWQTYVDKPKSETSIRLIPLSNWLANELKMVKIHSKSEYVVSKNKKRTNSWTLRYHYQQLMKEIGLDSYSFHELRHTFATRAIESNMDIRTLSEILGHSDPGFTLDTYVSSNISQKRLAMNKIKNVSKIDLIKTYNLQHH